MSDYTIVNLFDSPDVAPGRMPEGVEARFPKQELNCTVGAVAFERLAPAARFPFGHRHTRQEELYVVVEGSGRVKLDDEVRDLRQWDVVRVAPQTMRCFEGGPDGIAFLAYGAAIATDSDAEIVPGWWDD
jgi:quercetin dioxygenase-like cupin family protein